MPAHVALCPKCQSVREFRVSGPLLYAHLPLGYSIQCGTVAATCPAAANLHGFLLSQGHQAICFGSVVFEQGFLMMPCCLPRIRPLRVCSGVTPRTGAPLRLCYWVAPVCYWLLVLIRRVLYIFNKTVLFYLDLPIDGWQQIPACRQGEISPTVAFLHDIMFLCTALRSLRFFFCRVTSEGL